MARDAQVPSAACFKWLTIKKGVLFLTRPATKSQFHGQCSKTLSVGWIFQSKTMNVMADKFCPFLDTNPVEWYGSCILTHPL